MNVTVDTRLSPVARAVRVAVAGTALLGALALPASPAFANTPDWNPVASEQLIQLPANMLQRSVEQSLRSSPLGSELDQVNANLMTQVQLLAELSKALDEAATPSVALRHQMIEAKSAYLDLVEQQHALREAAVTKRLRVYRNASEALRKDARAARDPVARELVERQQAARARMESTAARVDSLLGTLSLAAGTNEVYAEQWEANLQKVEALKAAIASHDMEQGPQIDGEVVTREAYLRHLIVQQEAEAALLAQEQEIFGYMARLVALDARQLELDLHIGGEDGDVDPRDSTPRVGDQVDVFIGR